MLSFLQSLFLKSRIFEVLGGIILVFLLAFPFPILLPIAKLLLLLFFGVVGYDIYILYKKIDQIQVERKLPKVFSLSDENEVTLKVKNGADRKLYFTVLDELPFQFQIRDFNLEFELEPGKIKQANYELRPVERGEYHFGNINIYISTPLGLVERRLIFEQEKMIPVYPSIRQMHAYALKAVQGLNQFAGVKKMRRIGHSYEFERIRNYVEGDDYRSINWKASSRRAQIMVNQYEDERAQQIYCIIDKSRVMKMPFDGLSLMDYAINSALVMSNIVLQKHDRAGLITFSDKIGSTIKADSQVTQLRKILLALYNEKHRQVEANYELLYFATRKLVRRRSLMFLYTNFESSISLERVLPVLRKINKFHLLVVIIFINTEIEDLSKMSCENIEDVYYQTTAQQFVADKQIIVRTMQQYGIQAILTRPEDLSVNTINKYLELKSRGLI